MATLILRFRKFCYVEPFKCQSSLMGFIVSPRESQANCTVETVKKMMENMKNKKGCDPREEEENAAIGKRVCCSKQWMCFGSCCWSIGCLCTSWWLLLFLFNFLPPTLTFPGFRVTELPGARLRREEGLTALHPVVLVPGIVTGGLELWEGKPCAEGLFRKRLWDGGFTEIFKRPLCWLEHLSLDKETGLDPPGIRVRAVPGLVAGDSFVPGYLMWAVLIENLAKIGYDENNLHMAAYDWRLSFHNTEVRDHALSRLKNQIELMFLTNGSKKVVVVPHSMGAVYFLHFLKWVEAPPPLGGGGGPNWCSKHIKVVMNIAPAFLGAPKTVANIISNEGKDMAAIRAMACGVLDLEILGFQTLEHFMRVSRTWDSLISMIPKGGETIWGDLDWSPEEGSSCGSGRRRNDNSIIVKDLNDSRQQESFLIEKHPKYGRMISFGKLVPNLPSFRVPASDIKQEHSREGAHSRSNSSCHEIWTEYDEISRESIKEVANNKAYTSQTVLDLLRVLAPKTMKRGEAQFSHGIADHLNDPKYDHYRYWSNPLETKLPNAPDMEIHCLYGVGIPTERSYVYKTMPVDRCKTIPFRINSSVEGDKREDSCLRGGVYLVDGDESVPVISAGFMCAKGWRGKTRFNPSGIKTYVREYKHKPWSSLLEKRGQESGTHAEIMGNVGLIEDVLRIAAGASGEEIGGDRIYSDIMRMSQRIDLQL